VQQSGHEDCNEAFAQVFPHGFRLGNRLVALEAKEAFDSDVLGEFQPCV
jgi:hypothetical protein